MSKSALGTKSDFVRALPIDLPTAEVVARARERGIKLSKNTIRYARYTMRHGNKSTTSPITDKLVGTASKLALLRRLVREVGYDAAGEVMDDLAAELGRIGREVVTHAK